MKIQSILLGVLILINNINGFPIQKSKLYKPNTRKNEKNCVVFFTGAYASMPSFIYNSFIQNIVKENISVCVPQYNHKNINGLINKLSKKYDSIAIIGHSSGCSVAIKNCNNKNIQNIILFDPVNTRLSKEKYKIQNIKDILYINAVKSYKITFDPFGLPFIPFLKITPELLETSKNSNINIINYFNYGHCDILDKPYSDFMHYTRISVGNKNRSINKYQKNIAKNIKRQLNIYS
tara:strand:+ start:27074 stop:27778 length:705 start_codon:yes stop_codon:yes gene_type:complete